MRRRDSEMSLETIFFGFHVIVNEEVFSPLNHSGGGWVKHTAVMSSAILALFFYTNHVLALSYNYSRCALKLVVMVIGWDDALKHNPVGLGCRSYLVVKLSDVIGNIYWHLGLIVNICIELYQEDLLQVSQKWIIEKVKRHPQICACTLWGPPRTLESPTFCLNYIFMIIVLTYVDVFVTYVFTIMELIIRTQKTIFSQTLLSSSVDWT